MQNDTIKQTVFDAEGNEFSLETVDAREYVASGSYFYDAPVKKSKPGRKAAAEVADAAES